MLVKKLTRITIVWVLAFGVLLQVSLAGGNDGNFHQNSSKINAPMELELYFTSEPMLDEISVLNVEIRVWRNAPNTQIEIELPEEGLELISGSTHLIDDLSSDSTKIYQLEILPVSIGQFKISVSATSLGTDFIFGRSEDLYLNIDDGFSELSKSSFVPQIVQHRSTATKIGNVSEPPIQVLPDLKPKVNPEVTYFSAPDPGQILVKGYWYYQDRAGVNQPLRDAKVEIWDADSSGDVRLATTYTNNSGYYASDNISNSDDEGGGQDIYVKVFSTDDRSVRVTDFSASSNLYYFATDVQNDVADGEVDLGTYVLDDATNRMAWYIYDLIANDAFDFLANVGWQNLYNLQVRWSPTSSEGTYYRLGRSIDLLAKDRWDSDVFLHEYGHFVMYKIYGNVMPPTPNCYNHFWGKESSLGCAWTEGWANFLQAAIQNDKFYDDTEDQRIHIDFEIPNPSVAHPEDEGAVAASLWDIFDPVSTTEDWDEIGNGMNGASSNGIWSIVRGDEPNDFLEFYTYWIQSSNGYNSEITAVAQHHQIDPDVTSPSISITSPTSSSTYATGSSSLNISGSASDNVGVTSVSWSNSRGGSGSCSGTTSWSKSGITLSSGQNVITVTARDAAGNTATDTLTVTVVPPDTTDTTPPTVSITAPTNEPAHTTNQSLLNIGGSASDDEAVTTVRWSNNGSGSGDCNGTTSWNATDIILSSGQNVITVTAWDAAGNTATDTLTVTYSPPDTAPEIVEKDSYPHDAQGMEEGTMRVPIDTSIIVRIRNDHGIDQDSIAMKIEDNLVDIRVQEVNEGDDTDCWIIHSPETPFPFNHQVNYTVDANSLYGMEMTTYYSSFKTESEEEHNAALAAEPSSIEHEDEPVSGRTTIAADPATEIEGARIIYENLEPVIPRFGPLDEIPDLDAAVGVGKPLNLQPTNVFVSPVTVYIPCPGETDLANLEVYVFHADAGWQASWETDGCIVPGSRVNHGPNDPDPMEPPTIEIQLHHFSGVQAGKAAEEISPSAGAANEPPVAEKLSGGGGGGGCFITAAIGESKIPDIDLTVFLLLLMLGFIGFLGIRRKLKK